MAWRTSFDTCFVETCDKEPYCKGLCSPHYQRFQLYGRYETVVWGQSTHPLYNMWNERKNKNQLCEEWLDFKIFLAGVGERPDGDFRMGRTDSSLEFGPKNFYWKEYYKVKEGETIRDKNIRRRAEKPDVYKRAELKKAFNLTYEDWEKLLKDQNYVCKVCKEPEKVKHHVTGKLKSLAVDHCHKTGKIRGLLCQRCNRVLGKVGDSISLLDRLKDHLNDNR